MKIACHAVLFGEEIKTNTDQVLAKLASTGAEGIELGARFFGSEESDKLKENLKAYGLELSGYHMVVRLTDFVDDPEKCRAALQKGADFLRVMPHKNIIMTGMIDIEKADDSDLGDGRLLDADFLERMAGAIDREAQRLWTEYGVRLHYHNHSWEWKKQACIYEALLIHTTTLYFAMDIGWTAVSGFEPVEWLKKMRDRVRYLHLRDYKKEAITLPTFAQIRESYVELGDGDMDYPGFMAEVKKLLPEDTWLVVEYETGEVNEIRYQKAISKLQTFL